MTNRGWLGAWVIGLCVASATSATGCADPPSQSPKNPSKPVATARVTSSALTKKVTGAKAWRIYEGRTQVVVMGFDAKGKPIDGIRFRYASKNDGRKWAVSLESLRDGGVLQVGKDGKPTKRTMSDQGVKILVGASRVLDAWTRKRAGGAIVPKALTAVASTASECGEAALGAVGDCAPLVAQCARWGYQGWQRGRHWGAAGATLVCLAYNYRRTAQCAGSAYGAGQTCYDAYQNQSSSEENKNSEPNASENPNGENPEEAASETDPESPENAGLDEASWESDESQDEAAAAAEDPEAPLEEQVDDSESYDDASYEDESSAEGSEEEEYDSNPSDPEEDAIADESAESEESSDEETDDSSYEEESSDDVETESFRTVRSAKARAGACGASRVLHCGSRPATAFCRCVK
jgi:hypothetical protein